MVTIYWQSAIGLKLIRTQRQDVVKDEGVDGMSRRVRLQVLFQGSDSEVVVPERELVVISFAHLH